MHQGEIFAYPLYLHMDLLKQDMTFFCQVLLKYINVHGDNDLQNVFNYHLPVEYCVLAWIFVCYNKKQQINDIMI